MLNTAFEKQFAHLMQGELLDIEADIELLKSTFENGGRKMKTKLIGLGHPGSCHHSRRCLCIHQ